MPNKVDLIVKYSSKAFDEVYMQEAKTAILDGSKELLKFTGAKTIKIAKPSVSGLGNYARANTEVSGNFGGDGHGTGAAVGTGYGYRQGAGQLVWEEFTISLDRAIQIRVDSMDDEETDGLAVAAMTKEETRTQIIPEIDAYVFSKLAEKAGTVSTSQIQLASGLGYNANGPLAALNSAFEALDEFGVPTVDQVVFCSFQFLNLLRNSGELVKTLTQAEYEKNVKFDIYEYMDRKLIGVPKTRFKTNIVIDPENGYHYGANSKDIDFIVVSKAAVYHVVKYEKNKVYGPDVVQDFDGYKLNFRIYHDCFVPDNKRLGIYVHTSANATTDTADIKFIPNFKLAANGDVTDTVITGVAVVPTNTYYDALYVATAKPNIGSAVSGLTNGRAVGAYAPTGIASGQAAATYYLVAAFNDKVVAVGAEGFTVPAAQA